MIEISFKINSIFHRKISRSESLYLISRNKLFNFNLHLKELAKFIKYVLKAQLIRQVISIHLKELRNKTVSFKQFYDWYRIMDIVLFQTYFKKSKYLRDYATPENRKRGPIWKFYYRKTKQPKINLHAAIHYKSFADLNTIFVINFMHNIVVLVMCFMSFFYAEYKRWTL